MVGTVKARWFRTPTDERNAPGTIAPPAAARTEAEP